MSDKELFQGYTPQVAEILGNPEALKYGRMWEFDQYRAVAPGEEFARMFLDVAKPRAGSTLIDFGCGTGRGGHLLACLGGLNVILVDFVKNSLDANVKEAVDKNPNLIFVKADLEKRLPVAAPYGFCTDVMEHIPTDKVSAVLNNILTAAQHVFFSISNEQDNLGALIGETLHLTVQPFEWWLDRFKERECKIHFAQDLGGWSLFYVSAWQTGQYLVDSGKLNIEEDQICKNVKANCANGWQQVYPHETNDFEVMILGGSPSLPKYLDEIRTYRAMGVKLITMNGSYNWALENGLIPSAQIVVDARAFNARFTKPVVASCKYLISSQCDPTVLSELPKDDTWIWHTTTDLIQPILDEHFEKWWAVPGGSTVLLRTIPLMRMLGYRKFILFGCDSCLIDGEHHAYAQTENDSPYSFPVVINPGGKTFDCHPWMASQATEFIDMIKVLVEEIELDVRGDGLLSYILEVGAKEAELIKEP